MGHHPRDHPGGRAAVRGRTEDVDLPLGSLIHGPSEKAHSRKPMSIHSHAYAVPGRMRARLFSELPRETVLGNPPCRRLQPTAYLLISMNIWPWKVVPERGVEELVQGYPYP